ncbi:MAG TPA: zinc-binding dehydrogenase [Polyangiaceae bacterium]|nr:zinc-binding dehydrogenase [Polyangiaceae bacterium]
MRAIVYAKFGDPESVLQPGERPVPEPRPGQVRVRMRRSVIHNHDLWTIRGTYGQRPSLPAVGGSEAAGVVEALGEGVTNLAVGQRVTGFATGGAWAESFVTSAAGALPLPDAISDDVGCQLVAMPLSALALVDHYRVGEGEWLVQNAANGAVGKTLAVVTKARGVRVIHLVRGEAGRRELAAAGVDDAISTAEPDWQAQVRARVGQGAIKYGFDSIGGRASGELLSLLAPGGTLVAFGSMSGEPMAIDAGELIFRQTKVEGFWLSKHPLGPEKAAGMVQELVRLVSSKALELPVAGVFPLDQPAQAVAASLRAGKQGKVLFDGA